MIWVLSLNVSNSDASCVFEIVYPSCGWLNLSHSVKQPNDNYMRVDNSLLEPQL